WLIGLVQREAAEQRLALLQLLRAVTALVHADRDHDRGVDGAYGQEDAPFPRRHSGRRPPTSTRLMRSMRPALPTNMEANHPVRPTTIEPRHTAPNHLSVHPGL